MVKQRFLSFLTFALLATGGVLRMVQADVVVVVNGTGQLVEFEADTTGDSPRTIRLAAGDLATIPMRETVDISCPAMQPNTHRLAANSAYYFTYAGDLMLVEIGLRSDERTRTGRELGDRNELANVAVIPIKILVDDDERAIRELWEARIRKRVEAASEIFTGLFLVRFEVIGVDTWTSDERAADFEEVFRDFERQVPPESARLVIGFSSQSEVGAGHGKRLGSARTPLHTHILIRESGVRITEAERLEVLVHELGHFFGAAHSPDPLSVMRPMLGDGVARRADFRITFDPINAIVVYLIAEEVRLRNVNNIRQIMPRTAFRLHQLYSVMAEVLPEDDAARRYGQILRAGFALPDQQSADTGELKREPSRSELVAGARTILEQFVLALRVNERLPATADVAEASAMRRSRDELTAHCIRVAAGTAQKLDRAVAPRAFLLAVGIGLDHSDILQTNPLLSDLVQAIETSEERAERRTVLGNPTARGRRDLAQHFAIAAFLTTVSNAALSEVACVAKELLDSRGGSGFSFADLAADYAGIAFAEAMLAGDLPLVDLARRFEVADYVPDVTDLPEGIAWDQFVERYGSVSDARFQRLREQIQERIRRLPGYAKAEGRVSDSPTRIIQ